MNFMDRKYELKYYYKMIWTNNFDLFCNIFRYANNSLVGRGDEFFQTVFFFKNVF